MILSAIQFTNTILEQYVRNSFQLTESRVILNDVIDENGSIPQSNQNKLVLSLINIERETIKPYNIRVQKIESGNYSSNAPVESYNLYLMLSSHFDDYAESIKFLNAGILFFQSHPVFDPTNYSDLPNGIQKLVFELDTINYHEMFNLWSAMGAKYRPSVIYKLRLLTLDPLQTEGFVSAVTEISNKSNLL